MRVGLLVVAMALLGICVVGVGQASKKTVDWQAKYERARAAAVKQRHRADDLQRRLTGRVLEARRLRRTLLHRSSTLEALRLAAIVYRVPFSALYRRASCESMGLPPASPPSERTLNRYAKNRSSSASGLLQFLDSTWASTPFAGESVWSPYANALAAGWMMGPAGRGGEWVCQ